MRIGLLQCDGLDRPHVDIDGDYDALFAAGLAPFDISLTAFRVDLGRLPRSPADCDAWIVSGSRRSVGDDLAWIADVRRFVGQVIDAQRPLIGGCFGHQLIASVLGAPVVRSESGWNVGALQYDLRRAPPGPDHPAAVTLIASHRDQVTELPTGCDLLLTADTCPIAGFIGDTILTVQAHPEFTAPLAASLFAGRRRMLGEATSDRAIESLSRQLDAHRTFGWMVEFVGAAGR